MLNHSGSRSAVTQVLRQRLKILAGLGITLAAFLVVTPVRAQTLTWGSLVTDSGPTVYDWQLQDYIDEFFEDGNKGDGMVGSDILIVGTSCYFGDFFDNFNGATGDTAGGGAFDIVKFTNTTVLSAQEAGKTAIYGGYDDDAAGALKPGATAQQIHDAGTSGKDTSENPQSQGVMTRTVVDAAANPTKSSHVLIWAGDPNAQDYSQIADIKADFPAGANQTVTVLAGDGTGPGATGAATLANLKAAIMTIGALMNANEQFVFYITDHGNIEKIDTSARTVAGTSSDGWLIDYDSALIDDWYTDPLLNTPEVQIWTDPNVFTSPTELGQIEIQLNGLSLGSLGGFAWSQIELSPGVFQDVYSLADPLLAGYFTQPVSQALQIINHSSTSYNFSAGLLGSGPVSKLVPEPSTLATFALAGMVMLGLTCIRRKRKH